MTSENKHLTLKVIFLAFWAVILAWGISHPGQFLEVLLMAVGSAIAMTFVVALLSLVMLFIEE